MYYKVISVGGGGNEQDEGIWEVKFTPKTMLATKTQDTGAFDNYPVGKKFKIGKGTGNPIEWLDEDEKEFIVYFEQRGIPFDFHKFVCPQCKQEMRTYLSSDDQYCSSECRYEAETGYPGEQY